MGSLCTKYHDDHYYYMHRNTGQLHREDGPAYQTMGDEPEWYINGKQLTFEEWKIWLKEKSMLPTNEITKLILKWS